MRKLVVPMVAFMAMTFSDIAFADHHNKLYQVSTIGSLSQGVYDGPFTFKQLMANGDQGLGTFNNLSGEMVAVDGKYYQINDKGDLRLVKPSQKTPFAEVTNFKPTIYVSVGKIDSYQALNDELLKDFKNKNIPYAIRVDGDFDLVKARNLRAQKKPYRPLVQAAKEQAVFDFKKVKGTMVGFWFPHYWNGIGVGGFHMHFVNDRRTTGGHVLEIKMRNAKISIAPMNDLQIILPNDKAFANANLDPVDLKEDLKAAEGGTD
ncbi:MAG: acetolactate decarboxylase [Coxiellaceae bacterium]|nr:acetolactate decarboxylase [Coxiellaceae bacterium]